MIECVFCEIVSKLSPARIILESNLSMAFLDIDPIQKGHVLVIPKRHVKDLKELNDDEKLDSMNMIQKVMKAIEEKFAPDGINIDQTNGVFMDVPHVHFHIIPRYKGDGFKMIEPDISVTEHEMDWIAEELKLSFNLRASKI